MAAHKWWRVVFTESANYAIAIDEVIFRNAARVDITTGGGGIGSGAEAAYPISNAFDKLAEALGTSSSTFWRSNVSPWPGSVWIGYVFAAAVDVSSVDILWGAGTGNLPVAYRMFLEYSDDGTTWIRDGVLLGDKGIVGTTAQVLNLWSAGSVRNTTLSKLPPRAVLGYNLEPQSPRRRLWAKGGTWRWETQTTGSGTISGIVTIENIPGSRKVRLYRKHDGMLLRETWSAPNGAYSFSNLDPAWEYFVVAHDHLRVYNGVIQDMIQP